MEMPPELLENGRVDLDWGWVGQASADRASPLPSSNGCPVPPNGNPAFLHRNLLACPEHFVLPLLFWLEHSSEPLPSGVLGPESHRPPSSPHPCPRSITGVWLVQHTPRCIRGTLFLSLFVGCVGGRKLYLSSLRSIKKGDPTVIQKLTVPCLWYMEGWL